MADRLSRLAHSLGIVKVTTLLGVVLVHPLHDFPQRRLPVTLVAQCKIEHHTQELTNVVVGNTAIRTAVISIAFEPGVKA